MNTKKLTCIIVFFTMSFFCGSLRVFAQSTTWDSLLTNTQWYVPAENLLAYISSNSSLNNPQALADQTIWTLGTCTNGVFTGSSNATMKLGPIETNSLTSMSGFITDAGQVRILFTADGSPSITGIGQVREQSGQTLVEMQMITGAGSYLTHWAYMALYSGGALPPLVIDPALISQEWSWMQGTSWSFSDWELSGSPSVGNFSVEGYLNGYFWGTGSDGNGTFSLMGSATPEGNVLFNTLQGSSLTSLTGLITGTSSNGTMALRSYNTDFSFGTLGYALVVPEPSSIALLIIAGSGLFLFGKSRTLRRSILLKIRRRS